MSPTRPRRSAVAPLLAPLLAVVLTAALLAVLVPTASHAQSPLPVDPGENAPITITDMVSLNVVLEPADHDAYAGLFGPPLAPLPPVADGDVTTPERPLIDFKLHEVVGGTMETWVDLRGTWCDRTGWFNNATAVQDAYLYAFSRAIGYPKIFAESITLDVAEDGRSATGVVTQLGQELIRLEWVADDAAVAEAVDAEPWYGHWVGVEVTPGPDGQPQLVTPITGAQGEAYRGVSWSYEPTADVGLVKEIQTVENPDVEQHWDSRPGMVTVTVNTDAHPLLTNGDWMQLVPETVTVPGNLEVFQGEADFFGRSLQCGLNDQAAGAAPPHVDPQDPIAVRGITRGVHR